MPTSSDEDDELLGIGLPAFKKNSSRVASRAENKMFSFLDRCVAEEEERSFSRIKIQKLMKEEEVASDQIVQTKSNNIDVKKEDDYWERVHQETAKSTTSAKARRRRQLEDAIDGIVSCGENEDDEDYWRDRAKRLGKASAITTALSTQLGTRRVFHREDIHAPKESLDHLTEFLPFASEIEAIKAMDTILSQISSKNRSEKSSISNLIELIKDSISSKNLPNLLLCSTISRWSTKYKTKVPLPIQSWLWKVLCSSSVEMAEGSMLTLKGIMCSRITDNRGCHSGGHGLISIKQINLMIKYIFGFYVTKAAQITSPSEDTSKAQTVGAVRLPPMLDVWNAAFQNDAVSIAQLSTDELSDNPKKENSFDEARELIGSLILATIDPLFHTGVRGMNALQQLILTALNIVQKKMCNDIGNKVTENNFEADHSIMAPDQFDLWLTNLVKDVLLQAQYLTEGDKGSSDMDDFNGYLPLSLMAKSIPISAPRLRAKFSEEALKKLCKNVKGLSDKRTELVARRCKELQVPEDEFPFSWKLLALAEAGLAYTGDMITSFDGPQLYAIIDTAKVCAESGRALSDVGNSYRSTIYKSTKDAAFACLSYESLETYCNQIKKGITCVFVNQHLRRSKELLTQISIYSKHMKIEAMKASGKHHGLKVQTTLEAWIDCEEKEEEEQS